MKLYVARDANGELYLYDNVPNKGICLWNGDNVLSINNNEFPTVKWEDNKPTEVEIVIKGTSIQSDNTDNSKLTKIKLVETGEIVNAADYARVTLDMCDSYGNPIEVPIKDIEILKEKTDNIDWEQRRYEIAKDVMCANICSPVIPGIDPNPSLETLSRHACAAADALIEELKKKGEKQ